MMPAGAPDPRLLQFLFSRQDEEKRARAQEQKDQFDQMLALQKADREQKTWELQQANARADLFSKIGNMTNRVSEAQRGSQAANQAMFTLDDLTIGKNGKTLGPEFGALVSELDPTALDQVRFTQAADQNLRNQTDALARMNQAVSGGSLGDSASAIRGQAFAGDVEERRQAALAEGVKDSDVERQIRADQRRQILADNLRRRAEREAAETGFVSDTVLENLRKSNYEELAFSKDVSSDYRWLNTFDPKNPNWSFEAMQKWQRRNDPGGTVREGDVAMMLMLGVTSYEALRAKITGIFSRKEKLPEGFAEALYVSVKSQLANEDQKIVDIQDNWKDYASQNGLTPAQERRGTQWRLQVDAARKRIDARQGEAKSSFSGNDMRAFATAYEAINGEGSAEADQDAFFSWVERVGGYQ